MLRGQAGRQWRGSFDLDFEHQATLGSLTQSADMACYICRRILEDMPLVSDPLKVHPPTLYLLQGNATADTL